MRTPKCKFVSLLAGLSLAGSLVATAAIADPRQDGSSGQPYRQNQSSPHQDQRSQPGERMNRDDARTEPRQHDRRKAWREDRKDAKWDDSQHNGYYRNNTWHRGQPSARQEARGHIVYGYQPWKRGQRLGYYKGRYAEVDYRERNLRAPPRGYHWVRDDNGDFLLAAIVSGVIAQVILNSAY